MSEQQMSRYDHDGALGDLRQDRDNLRALSQNHPSRELSLAITNLEQAIHWLADVSVQED